MAWSYDPANLTLHRNWIRLRIGDTDTLDQQIQDEEIDAHLAADPRREFAAANVAEAIAADYARVGAARESEVYLALAESIRMEAVPAYL